MRRLLNVVIVAALLSFPRVVSAQEDPRKVQAESLFAEGLKLHDSNRDADALAKYRQAYGLFPTANILFAIARVEQVLGQSLAAITHFREALKSPIVHPRNQELGKTYVAELEKKLARVTVIGPAGLKVILAGREHRLPIDGVVDVEPGAVDARGDLDGKPYAGKVETLAGTQAILEMKPVQAASSGGGAAVVAGPGPREGDIVTPPPPTAPTKRWGTGQYVGAGVAGAGLVALGVGVGFIIAKGNDTDVISELEQRTGGSGCGAGTSSRACQDLEAKRDERDRNGDFAVAFFVGGGVAVIAGVVAFLVSPKASTSAETVTGRTLAPRAGGFELRF